MSGDLVAFLRARLDERAARAWAIHDVGKCDALLYEEDMAAAAAEVMPDCDCGYPALVLAEVEAKRRIIDWCDRANRVVSADDYEMDVRTPLELLALPYAGQPGYRPEWAAEAAGE